MEDLRFYTLEYTVPYSQADAKGQMKPGALLSLFTNEMAENHSAMQGFGRQQMLEKGMVFLLSKVSIRFCRMPKAMETLQITTYERGAKGAQYRRLFTVKTQSGEIVAEAVTLWVLADMHAHKILRPSAFPFEIHVYDQPVDVPMDKHLHDHGEGQLILQRPVCYSDVDVNGHLNNAKYLDIVCDCLTCELQRADIEQVQIHYVKEAALSDKLQIYKSVQQQTVYLWAQNGEQSCFEAKVQLSQ